MRYGIDISHWQGEVDFAKLNTDFVIMKLSQFQTADPKFSENYFSCNLPKGCYIYNKVKTVADAIKEAQYAVRVLAGRSMPLGVWLDLEDSSMRKLSKQTLNAIISAESGILKAAGYDVGIYCNRDWYLNVLDSSVLAEMFPFWIARYPLLDNGTVKQSLSPESLKGCKIWQYSSKGNVNGIKGNVDMNLCFGEITNIFKRDDATSLPKTETKPVLKYGSRNDYVKAWQMYLNTLGYGLTEDGIFGIATQMAVKKYQASKGLVPDGVIGANTWASIGL